MTLSGAAGPSNNAVDDPRNGPSSAADSGEKLTWLKTRSHKPDRLALFRKMELMPRCATSDGRALRDRKTWLTWLYEFFLGKRKKRKKWHYLALFTRYLSATPRP